MGHGSVLAGRYRLEERVRTRPDGSTWRAVDEILERLVLVQAFALGHPHGAEIVDAARRAALVQDSRLQRVLAAGEERGTSYVVLERVPGRTLDELLGSGPLPAETARRVIGEAAEALDRASTRGLHHLRLSPSSIVVGRDGTVAVSGTAIDAAADGAEPPNSAVARRSDAVGLVALLYAALTARWPGSQEARLPRAPRVAGRPVAPGDLVPGVPNDLDTLCAVTLGPYDDGPRTPGDLARELAPWAPPGPLTDPRGLQIAATRPGSSASPGARTQLPTVLPVERPPARRTPPWGLRAARFRSQALSRATSPPVLPSENDDGEVAPPGPGAGSTTGSTTAADAQAGVETGGRGGQTPSGRSWATVEELREALRSNLRGPASPAGNAAPLAATPPPTGAPLTWSGGPPGPPTATTPPLGRPLAPSPPQPTDQPAEQAPAPAAQAPAQPPAPAADPASGHRGREPRNRYRSSEPTSADAPATVEPPPHRAEARVHARSRPADPVPPPGPGPDSRPVDPRPVDSRPVDSRPVGSRRVGSRPVGSRRVGSRPPRPVDPAAQGSGRGRSRPRGRDQLTGVDALDILGAVAQPVEPVAPFGPSTPLTRPPRGQSWLVVVVLAVLVLVVGFFAATRFLNFDAAPLITPSGGATPTASSSPQASSGPASSAPSAGASPAPSATVSVAGAAAIDPQGDNNENGDLAKNAIDGDTSTSWHSERYDSATFGGIKKGLGLVLDLGDTSTVTAVTLNAPGTDGRVELRASDSGQFDGSQSIASGKLSGSGSVTLTPTGPTSTRYLILWFTRVPQNGGERRIVVNEVDVR